MHRGPTKMCQDIDSPHGPAPFARHSLKLLGSRLAALPEYRDHEVQVAQVAWALVRIAESGFGRSIAPECFPLARRLLASVGSGSAEACEALLLELYSRLHELGSSYSAEERMRLDSIHGYINYPGGLSPILQARSWLRPESTSVDLGAGNGLQGILLQELYPHRRTIQVELSGELIATGRKIQALLGIPVERLVWAHTDIASVSLRSVDFVYLYRPARPTGEGEALYRRIAENLEAAPFDVVVFSVADCLGSYLGGGFCRIYTDGHLSCYARSAAKGAGEPK